MRELGLQYLVSLLGLDKLVSESLQFTLEDTDSLSRCLTLHIGISLVGWGVM